MVPGLRGGILGQPAYVQPLSIRWAPGGFPLALGVFSSPPRMCRVMAMTPRACGVLREAAGSRPLAHVGRLPNLHLNVQIHLPFTFLVDPPNFGGLL